jgi:hypothetical protein
MFVYLGYLAKALLMGDLCHAPKLKKTLSLALVVLIKKTVSGTEQVHHLPSFKTLHWPLAPGTRV